ncbi:hypothetical protein EDD37DRAFT_675422 [Exophiala viscosa]|uniref:uncharacterized protein n=1 Tax=Exophiala viscosa TaxID=2486360 RepID=UPI00219DE9D7|nr:hypothetical protein EDD37DRAFT_675422 [Exophiala viscosa]
MDVHEDRVFEAIKYYTESNEVFHANIEGMIALGDSAGVATTLYSDPTDIDMTLQPSKSIYRYAVKAADRGRLGKIGQGRSFPSPCICLLRCEALNTTHFLRLNSLWWPPERTNPDRKVRFLGPNGLVEESLLPEFVKKGKAVHEHTHQCADEMWCRQEALADTAKPCAQALSFANKIDDCNASVDGWSADNDSCCEQSTPGQKASICTYGAPFNCGVRRLGIDELISSHESFSAPLSSGVVHKLSDMNAGGSYGVEMSASEVWTISSEAFQRLGEFQVDGTLQASREWANCVARLYASDEATWNEEIEVPVSPDSVERVRLLGSKKEAAERI